MSRRQAGADYYGTTRREASIMQWKGLNQVGTDPALVMDQEDFEMGRYYMEGRLWRMINAMETVYPSAEKKFRKWIEEMGEANIRGDFLEFLFDKLHNRVWPLIRSEKGLTEMLYLLNEFLNARFVKRRMWHHGSHSPFDMAASDYGLVFEDD